MKKVAVFGSIAQFEAFVNDPKLSVIDVKVSTCEQSYNFQECFVGVVFYEDAPQNAMELATTDSQQAQPKSPSTPSMSLEQFRNSVDGLVNDFEESISDGKEFRTGIMELLLEVTEPFIGKTPDACPKCKSIMTWSSNWQDQHGCDDCGWSWGDDLG